MLVPSTDRTGLFGRSSEIQVLTELLDGVGRRGAALVLRGDPGIGKSRLLSEAVALAEQRQMHVLATTGVQSEAQLAFAGLQQLLRPVRGYSDELSAAHRTVLDAALGVGQDQPPEPFRIALAVLDLLSEAATDRPLLVVAEDAHWLDQPTVDVLSFVARRIESDPIVLLAAARDGYPTTFRSGELPELRIQPLDAASAGQLLEACSEPLSPSKRGTVLQRSAGNPLALVELPSIAHRLADERLLPGVVPLTERMERAFAVRAADLPPETQLLLLVAGLNDSESLAEALQAGEALADGSLDASMLQPAADVAIIELDERTLRFRHPLMRSAVIQAAPVDRRRRVHEALADVLSDEPDRRVWHRAALITGHHESIAVELEEAATRARRRGAAGVAVLALRRAADLGDPGRRLPRLLAAASLAFELGQVEVVGKLLDEAERLEPGPIERARITWVDVAVNTVVRIRPLGGPRPARSMIEQAEAAGQAGDRVLHIDLLGLAALRASWFGMDDDTKELLLQATKRVGPPDPGDSRLFATYIYADPFSVPAASMARLRAMVAAHDYDRRDLVYLGSAAFNAAAFDVAEVLVRESVDILRDGGRLGSLPRMLTVLGLVAARLADWSTAIPAAEEARRLA